MRCDAGRVRRFVESRQAGGSVVGPGEFGALERRRGAPGRVGRRFEPARGRQRPAVLEDADAGRTFKSLCNRRQQGALERKIALQRRAGLTGGARAVVIEKRAAVDAGEPGMPPAPAARLAGAAARRR